MEHSNVTNLYPKSNNTNTPFYESRWFKLLQSILKPVLNLHPLKRYISKSKSGSMGLISSLCKKGEYLRALELSINGVEKCNTKNSFMDDFYWWFYLSHAVYCARMLNNKNLINKLIKIANNGFRTNDANYVSYCYCQFSHFMYAEGEYSKAIEFAERAMAADSTDAEPYYLLGFYDLFVKEKDPLYHFKEAVKRDNKFLNRIVNHPSIKEFPGIINELRNLEIVDLTKGSNLCFHTATASPRW